MRKSVWNRKIPSLFVFVFLAVSFLTVTYLTGNQNIFYSRAAPGQDPEDVKISNITDTSFTVSYHTAGSVLGSVAYQIVSGPQTVVLDDRDQKSGTPQNHMLHHITVKNLKPDTTYLFSIISGNKSFDSDNQAPYQVITGDALTLTASPHLIQGTLIYPTSDQNESIVYATLPDSETLSALVKNDGTYSIDVGLIRDTTLKQYIYDNKQIVHLLFQSNTLQSNVSANSSTIMLPAITVGQDYDFTQSTSSSPASNSASIAFLLQDVTLKPQTKVSVIVPSNGQSFSDQQPSFSGTSAPYSTVSITIEPQKIDTSVKADNLGYWHYTPSEPLNPGKQTLTISAKDNLGITRNVSSIIYIFASGAQFLEPSVSPAVSPTNTLTPTQILTPTASLTATPTNAPSTTPGIGGVSPTATLTPTITPTTVPTVTVLPTNTPTATPTSQPTVAPQFTATPTPKLLPSGSNSVMIGSLIALIPVILGGVLIYLSRRIFR